MSSSFLNDTIEVPEFYKENESEYIDLEVDVSFYLTHNGIEDLNIDSVWNVSSEEPQELNLKDFSKEELNDLNSRVEKELFDKQEDYEHDIYLAQADKAYDDFKSES